MNFPYYVYVGGPIDLFAGTLTESELVDYMLEYKDNPDYECEFDEGEYDRNGPLATKFADIRAYMRFFTDGELRQEIRAFAIPCSNSTEYGFIAKLDNNGETYVFSPEPLDYLVKKHYFSLEREP